jgi:hypothetical protein
MGIGTFFENMDILHGHCEARMSEPTLGETRHGTRGLAAVDLLTCGYNRCGARVRTDAAIAATVDARQAKLPPSGLTCFVSTAVGGSP